MSEEVSALVTDIMTAVSNCSLYSKEHASVIQNAGRAMKRLEDLYSDGEVSFTALGGRLLCNDVPVVQQSLHITNFVKRLRRKGYDRIVFRKGVEQWEVLLFISDLAGTDSAPRSTKHITMGALEVRLKGGGSGDVALETEKNVGRVREVYQGLSRFGKLDTVGLEDVVISFIGTLKREANILKVMSPVKSYSEYTFAHTTNVTILSIFQAESLGLKGEILHDVGLAGLLHDVGKMFISKDVLDKESKLTPEEWELMKMHTVYGAMHLCAQQDVPKLAVIAAYEHHMRFDGLGYPDTKRRGRNQHIISQIVAISDFFDALRTERPYRKALDVPVILALMEESSGSHFNPVLVKNFIETLRATKVL